MGNTFREVTVYDGETGEIQFTGTSFGSPNGKGYVLVYTEKVQQLILDCPSAATLKIFMLISMNQQFEDRGYITTKKAVQEKLGITKPTCLDAFKWLKERFIVNECKINGHTEFMINPEYVTIGRDKKARTKEWLRRWAGQTVATLPAKTAKFKVPKLGNASGRSMTFE